MDAAKIKELLEGPGLKPPPGVKPNFVDPPNQKPALLGTASLCLIVATVCVCVRAYTRLVILRTHGWEDYTCFLAFLGLIAYVSLMFSPLFRDHAGIHQWNIRGKDLQDWTKLANGIEIAYIPIIFIAKLSILLLYIRVFVPGGWRGRTKTFWVIQGVILFNLLFYIANIPIEIWPCIPRSKLWMPFEQGHCINNEAVFVAGGTINMVADFAILLIPIVSVWRLKMSTRRRIGLSGIFAFGIFGCIASIMHLATSVTAAKSEDVTHDLFPVALWTLAEIASAIICSCLIFVPGFIKHVGPKVSSRLSSITHLHYHHRSSDDSGFSGDTAVSRRAPPASAKWADRHSAPWKRTGSSDDDSMIMGQSKLWHDDDEEKGIVPVQPAVRAQGATSFEQDRRPVSTLPTHVAVTGAKKEARGGRLDGHPPPLPPKKDEEMGQIRVEKEWIISR